MIVVTGATGNIGQMVVRRLREAGAPVVALVRNAVKAKGLLPPDVPLRIGDYNAPKSLAEAFIGAQSVIFIPSDGEAKAVINQHANIVSAISASTVPLTVFIGIVDIGDHSPFYFAPVYRLTEQMLRDAGLPHSNLRCNLYSEFVRDQFLRKAFDSGSLQVPWGSGKIAPISRSDDAEAAIALVQQPKRQGQTFSLCGPQALDGSQLAKLTSHAWHRQIQYVPQPHPEYLNSLRQSDHHPWPHAFSSMSLSIEQGNYEAVQDDVNKLLEGDPVEFGAVLSSQLPTTTKGMQKRKTKHHR